MANFTGIEDLRTTTQQGLGGAKALGWYPGTSDGTQTFVQSPGILYAVPLTIGINSVVVTRMGWSILGGGGHGVRLGIYDSRSDGWPSARLFDSGTITTSEDSNWVVTVASTELAASAMYWTVSIVSSRNIFVMGPQQIPDHFGLTPDLTTGGYSVTCSFEFGTLPATFPGSGRVFDDGPYIGVQFR